MPDDYINQYYSLDDEPDDIECRGGCLGDILSSVVAWIFLIILVMAIVALIA